MENSKPQFSIKAKPVLNQMAVINYKGLMLKSITLAWFGKIQTIKENGNLVRLTDSDKLIVHHASI
jgi:hypothetical protein